jgi:hypothetical protein
MARGAGNPSCGRAKTSQQMIAGADQSVEVVLGIGHVKGSAQDHDGLS